MMDEPIANIDEERFEARDVWLLKRILQGLLVANVITVGLWAFWTIVTEHPGLIP